MRLNHVSKANIVSSHPGLGLRSSFASIAPVSTKRRSHQKARRKRGHPQFPVVISKRPHPIPSRTRKLSSSEPMVLHGKPCGRVGRRRDYLSKGSNQLIRAFCLLRLSNSHRFVSGLENGRAGFGAKERRFDPRGGVGPQNRGRPRWRFIGENQKVDRGRFCPIYIVYDQIVYDS